MGDDDVNVSKFSRARFDKTFLLGNPSRCCFYGLTMALSLLMVSIPLVCPLLAPRSLILRERPHQF